MSAKIDLKVVLLGKAFAGKTSVVERFIHDRFSGDAVPYQNTIGAAFGAKKVEVGNRGVTMGIWDTAGSERYEAMSRIYYRGARAAIVCYDLTDRTSFDRAKFWVNELRQNEESCKIYLAGTKLDLLDDQRGREVDYHMTTDYGDEIGAEVFETSSKSGHNIKELFIRLAMDFLDSPSHPPTYGEDTVAVKTPGSSADNNKSKCACVV